MSTGHVRQNGQRTPWLEYAVVAVAAFGLYAATANRGAQWQDSGWHIWRIVTGELHHPLGLALSHPLHYWISQAFLGPGLLEPCWAITLVSAVARASVFTSLCMVFLQCLRAL